MWRGWWRRWLMSEQSFLNVDRFKLIDDWSRKVDLLWRRWWWRQLMDDCSVNVVEIVIVDDRRG